MSITDSHGQVLTDGGAIAAHFQSYYKDLLGTREDKTGQIELEVVRMGPVLDETQQVALIKPFTRQEVKEVLWTIQDFKSPGSDMAMVAVFIGLPGK